MKIVKILGFLGLLCVVFFLISSPGYYYLFKDSAPTSSASFPSDKTCEGVVVYLINLDRSHERYDYVWPSLRALGFPVQRISAVDGLTLTEDDLAATTDSETFQKCFAMPPKLGTIGCSLSHIKTWRAFLESSFQFALICEDDISFSPPQLSQMIHQLIDPQQARLWDINSFELHHRGMPLTIRKLQDGSRLTLYLAPVTHTGAYLINRKAARALLAKALPIKMPIDHYFTRVWEFSLKFTGIEPRVVTQSYGDSEINSVSSPHKTYESNRFFYVSRALYTFQSQLMRFFYNLKQYGFAN